MPAVFGFEIYPDRMTEEAVMQQVVDSIQQRDPPCKWDCKSEMNINKMLKLSIQKRAHHHVTVLLYKLRLESGTSIRGPRRNHNSVWWLAAGGLVIPHQWKLLYNLVDDKQQALWSWRTWRHARNSSEPKTLIGKPHIHGRILNKLRKYVGWLSVIIKSSEYNYKFD